MGRKAGWAVTAWTSGLAPPLRGYGILGTLFILSMPQFTCKMVITTTTLWIVVFVMMKWGNPDKVPRVFSE